MWEKVACGVVLLGMLAGLTLVQVPVVFADSERIAQFTFDGMQDGAALPTGLTGTNVSAENKNVAAIVKEALLFSRRGETEPSIVFTLTSAQVLRDIAVVDFKIKKNSLNTTQVKLGGAGGSNQVILNFNSDQYTAVSCQSAELTSTTVTSAQKYPLNEFFDVHITVDYFKDTDSTIKNALQVWVNGEQVVSDGYTGGGTSLVNLTVFAKDGAQDVWVDDVMIRGYTTPNNFTEQQKLDMAKDMLTYNTLSHKEHPKQLTAALALPQAPVLPTDWENDITIAWESDDEATINSSTGAVTRPAIGQPDKEVTLTATISKGELSATKQFNFTVLSKNHVYQTDFSDWPYSSFGVGTGGADWEVPFGNLHGYRTDDTGVKGETTAVTGNDTEDLFNSVFQYQRSNATSPSNITLTSAEPIAYPVAGQELAIKFKYKPSRTVGDAYTGYQGIVIGREDEKNEFSLRFNYNKSGLLNYQLTTPSNPVSSRDVEGFEVGTGKTHDMEFILHSDLTQSIFIDGTRVVDKVALRNQADKTPGKLRFYFEHNGGTAKDASIIDDLSICYRSLPMYDWDGIALFDNDGNKLNSPEEDTTGAIRVKPNTVFLMEETDNIRIIAALYDADGVLLKAAVAEDALSFYKTGLSLDNTAKTGSTVSVFAWDWNTLMPYACWQSGEAV